MPGFGPAARRMKWLDWMVNLAGLLLWLGWRGFGALPVSTRPALTLASNLRPAGRGASRSRWALPSLFALLLGRAVLHHEFPLQFAEAVIWSPGAVSVTFRSDLLGRMLAYSFLGWFEVLLITYLGLAVFAGLRRTDKDPDPLTRSVRAELGWLSRWPVPLAPIPFLLVAAMLWMGIAGWLADSALLPPFVSTGHRLQQSAVVAMGFLPPLKWPLVAACLFRFLLDHVYLGTSPFWEYAHETGGRLVRWLRWLPLRLGSLDLAPLVAAAAYWAAGYFLEGAIPRLFQRLPL